MQDLELEQRIINYLDFQWSSNYFDRNEEHPTMLSKSDIFLEDGSYVFPLEEDTYVRLIVKDEKVSDYSVVELSLISLEEMCSYNEIAGETYIIGDVAKLWLTEVLKNHSISELSDKHIVVLRQVLNDSMQNSPLKDYYDNEDDLDHARFCFVAMKAGVLPWDVYH